MSRIGRLPVAIPAGVTVKVDEKNLVTVKGPKGELTQQIHPDMKINVEGAVLTVSRPSDEKLHKSLHGLSRTLINNMIIGVTKGYAKELTIEGTGFKAQVQGKKLLLWLGFASPKEFAIPEGITVKVDDKTQTIVSISGADKEVVGESAARVRGYYPAEPYKGKGIRYTGEQIRRKQGKKVA